MFKKYTISHHPSGYKTVKDLFDESVAVIDSEEHLSFASNASTVVKQEVKEFLRYKNIPFF